MLTAKQQVLPRGRVRVRDVEAESDGVEVEVRFGSIRDQKAQDALTTGDRVDISAARIEGAEVALADVAGRLLGAQGVPPGTTDSSRVDTMASRLLMSFP